MAVNSIFTSLPVMPVAKQEISLTPTTYEAQQNFGSYLKAAIDDVNKSQVESDVVTQKLVLGQDVELHEVMIAAQKAAITLNATMEVRNKVIEAYQEIIRMPV